MKFLTKLRILVFGTILTLLRNAFIMLVVMGLVAFISGTIIFIAWPIIVPEIFPGLVKKNILIAELTYRQALLLACLMVGLLYPAANKSNNQKEDIL